MILIEEKQQLFQKIKQFEDINFEHGQTEQTLNLLTCKLKENPFHKAKPDLGLSENNVLKWAPSTLYDFDKFEGL